MYPTMQRGTNSTVGAAYVPPGAPHRNFQQIQCENEEFNAFASDFPNFRTFPCREAERLPYKEIRTAMHKTRPCCYRKMRVTPRRGRVARPTGSRNEKRKPNVERENAGSTLDFTESTAFPRADVDIRPYKRIGRPSNPGNAPKYGLRYEFHRRGRCPHRPTPGRNEKRKPNVERENAESTMCVASFPDNRVFKKRRCPPHSKRKALYAQSFS